MEAFGVGTWEQVIALFKDMDSLVGNRWGWLEILRRAKDGDYVSGVPWEQLSSEA